jgi:3-methyladenine DNA glycosylase/8-oxoguanine DNA glycosylase
MESRRTDLIETTWRPGYEVDPWLTLAPMRHGYGDPTFRLEGGSIWRATRTPAGPATINLAPARGVIKVTAWGPGAGWAVDSVPRLLGAGDDPGLFAPVSGRLRDLARRHAGVRFGRSDAVFEAIVPAVCEQKVTSTEAQRAYRQLVLRFGDPAPGPGGLRLVPDPSRLARLPYWALHPMGLEQRRSNLLRTVGARAAWLESAGGLPAHDALARLQALPGIGPWTAAEVARVAFGDADAVSVGDFHLPHLVSWALAGEPRGTDARMLELLEPYRGQRARVVRLLELSGIRPPRFGPRMAPRAIAPI